jgi:predicted enzyme related to lactoylglutathione lyase
MKGTTMAKLLGPDFISLQVRDLAASRRFYTELLGLEVSAFTAPDFVLFESTTIPFGISQRPPDQAEPAQPAAGVALWIDCDNVDELHSQLVAGGATILRPPAATPFGRAVVFADPDGYRITANQNPWDQFPLGGRYRAP